MSLIEPQLKALLVCPACHGELDEETAQLRCRDCKRAYPVREFPVMLLDEEVASEEEAESSAP